MSLELWRRLCKGAVLGPFEEALALIEELTGVKVPKRSAQQIVLESACDFDAFYTGLLDRAPGLLAHWQWVPSP